MKLLFRGAEASLFETSFLNEKAILKKREPKNYRVKALDQKIVSLRTKQECLLISRAKEVGVRTPLIFYANKKTGEIIMEFVDGVQFKDLAKKAFEKNCSLLGKEVGLLHNEGIVHGDLTTSNVLVKKNKLVFVDFGLGFFSKKIEDMAVDLLVLKKTLKSTHSKEPLVWEKFLSGYKKSFKNALSVINRISDIEKRTRYS